MSKIISNLIRQDRGMIMTSITRNQAIWTLTILLSSLAASTAFQTPATCTTASPTCLFSTTQDDEKTTDTGSSSVMLNRRTVTRSIVAAALPIMASLVSTKSATAEETDFVQSYPDFTKTEEGWSYKDVKPGKEDSPSVQEGDRVVYDWSGYTIGYFGRPFEAKGGPQGGAFDKDLDFSRTVIGSHTIVGGLECALKGMKLGGVRQVVVPYGALSYPEKDMDHVEVGPKPTTFSGMRALNFVLANPRVDRTLLFNVKLIRVDRKDVRGGFIRGEKI